MIFYELPDDQQEFETDYLNNQTAIQETELLVGMTSEELNNYTKYFAGIHSAEIDYNEIYSQGLCSYLEEMKLFIYVQKATFYHMNYLE